ncbi:WG repeat-containing protein [Paenibacillus pini]|uniref:WG repeat-containing protein n=1 Tax=Paenibacillus pini JCM 16418 TaxID=1236976 RepID=W7Z169_9BACL|nr:WG repeat-containing protein [Paenibacillus pini]GAF10746.1 hypothetical protein JCM16418_4966 [Paenibacillus pini JCM 16418]
MIKKLGLALLILCTTVTLSGTSLAASITTNIEVSKTILDYNNVRPESDGSFHDGLLFAERSDGSLTYYNTKGNTAFTLPKDIEPISDFFEQRAIVRNKETKRFGYINTLGKLAISCQYNEVGYFSEGVAHVTLPDANQEALIDRIGKTVTLLTTKYSSDYYFTNGLSMVTDLKSKKIGFINTLGRLTIPSKYTNASAFSEGMATVQNSKGAYGYIDTTGKVIIPFNYKSGGDFSEGLAPVQNTKGKWGFIDKTGKIMIPFQYDNAHKFSEGLAIVYNHKGQVGFINKKGVMVVGYQKYTIAFNFKEGITLVGIGTTANGKFGYMDRQGKLLTKLEYRSESSSFNGGYAVAIKAPGKAVILTKRSLTK